MTAAIRTVAVSALLVLGLSASAIAGPITPASFQGGQIVVDYNNLGLAIASPTPFVIAGDTYTTDDGFLRYNNTFGALIGRTSGGVGTNTDTGYLDIAFGSQWTRVGGWIGASAIWTAQISFFDSFNTLLGSQNLGAASGGVFFGWEDSGGIARIRISDTMSNVRIIVLDDLTVEAQPVPEPATLGLLGMGLLAVGHIVRKKLNRRTA